MRIEPSSRPTDENTMGYLNRSEDSDCGPREREEVNDQQEKRVRWSTITVYEFGVGLGGSAVSDRGGPSIGLADKPEFTWTTKVGEMAECSEGIHRFSPHQRTRLLKAAGISEGIISRYARETNIILRSRRRTKDDEETESEESELEDDESEDEYDSMSRKRKAETQHSMYIGHPHFVPMRRPRMIPTNYV
ncbi:hypothetical protein Poli38472_011565 [Pythium oligandrum]|uniref:Uncharacterized protein n=1 Tax=Pythium oligandrum TaxID=41045 RepID=A0A8K1CL65_PYTOL|nr:hypothetical protein Poli38472_011565 [Pythium oligandrum]|eukprot:TMW64685.1 hypothetical protein Poli38472_011565 [Pythium oligandrum]